MRLALLEENVEVRRTCCKDRCPGVAESFAVPPTEDGLGGIFPLRVEPPGKVGALAYRAEQYAILDNRERPYYEHRLAAWRDTLTIVRSDEVDRTRALSEIGRASCRERVSKQV